MTKNPWERTEELAAMIEQIPADLRKMSGVRRALESDTANCPAAQGCDDNADDQ